MDALFQGIFFKNNIKEILELMVEALRKKGLPIAYVPFDGESHGFRQAKNIKRSLDAELYFYSKIFNFKISGREASANREHIGVADRWHQPILNRNVYIT